MRALGAIEKIFRFISIRFGVCCIAIWVWDFCSLAKGVDTKGMPMADEGGEGCCGNHVAV